MARLQLRVASRLTRRGLVDDLRELLQLDLMEVFAAAFQLLESLHHGLGHAPVRLLGAAHDGELFARRDALVAVVVVQAEAQQGGARRGLLLTAFLGAHAVTLLGTGGVSSGFSTTASTTMSANASSCLMRSFLSRVSSSIARNVATSRRR